MFEKKPTSGQEIARTGVSAVTSSLIGIGLLAGSFFISLINGPIGWIIGGALIVLGVVGLGGKSKADKKGGIISLLSGLVLALPILGSTLLSGVPVLGDLGKFSAGLLRFSSGVLAAGGVGFLAYGVYHIIKFRRGISSRR